MRVLFTSNPGLGHIRPMVPLARARAGPDAGPRIRAAGFERRAELHRCLAATGDLC